MPKVKITPKNRPQGDPGDGDQRPLHVRWIGGAVPEDEGYIVLKGSTPTMPDLEYRIGLRALRTLIRGTELRVLIPQAYAVASGFDAAIQYLLSTEEACHDPTKATPWPWKFKQDLNDLKITMDEYEIETLKAMYPKYPFAQGGTV